ncbi:cbb3-type cytochrome oxidase assembly protein CcoS [Pontibacter silvestris]|uniref:Cbb3-type cytochrome oxidase assembly protein CcoS n=1 Tax=Pontibacter silvestris TaxID=2305183 RepID=A0ABW4WXG4_9BACT|nr:cbb3-type cytochrome oxidase assembly protein CcoS [Pontibacter silvestris]MCC9137372.1 cbb3-type cytochrome oxidase assembly protein CcoS [Pontibacter silvestris]
MIIIFLLIGISVTVASGFLGGFLWAVRSGQFDDDYTPAVRMLFENEVTISNDKTEAQEAK